MVDIDRFKLLLDYSLDGKTTINKSDLIMICKLYLETDKEETVKILEEQIGSIIDTDISKEDLLSKLLQVEDPLTVLISKLKQQETSESEEELDHPTKALLRGKLSIADGEVLWQGNWSTSVENYKSGDKYRFKYKLKAPFTLTEGLIKPESGNLEGSFMLGSQKSQGGLVKVKENKFKLKFGEESGGCLEVVGSGENQFGNFTIAGKYSLSDNKLAVERIYQDKTLFDTDSDGDDEEFVDEAAFSADDQEGDLDDEGDAQAELHALLQEATLPLEQVRQHAQSSGQQSSSSEPPKKKPKQ